MENVRNRIKVEFIEKGDNERVSEQEPKLPINGTDKGHTIHDSYTFKQNEVILDEPI